MDALIVSVGDRFASASVDYDKAAVVRDSFTDTAGIGLQTHVSDSAVGWVRHANFGTGSIAVTDANRVRSNTTNTSLIYAIRQPDVADYDVEADFVPITALTNCQIGIAGRIDPAASTYYFIRYRVAIGGFELMRSLAGSNSTLGTYTDALPQTRRVTLSMRGSTISMLVDGVTVLSVTNAEITANGYAGVFAGAVTMANSTGVHLDNFRVLHAPSKFVEGVTTPTTVSTYYVDVDRGSDANPGTDDLPFATWGKAYDTTPDMAIVVYVSGAYNITTLMSGKRDRSAPITFMPSHTRDFSFAQTNFTVPSCDNWRMVDFQLPGKKLVLRGSSNATIGSKRFQVIGTKAMLALFAKSQYSVLSGCELTGGTAAAKAISYEANGGDLNGWLGNHYAYVQDVYVHDNVGDGFCSLELTHEFILRRVRITDTTVFGGDHADGAQIESPCGLEMTDVFFERCNGSGGALFLAKSSLPGAQNTPKCHVILRNVGCFDANTNGIVIGSGNRIFVSHLTGKGTGTFGDLKIGTVLDGCIFVNSLIDKYWQDNSGGATVFTYRQTNIIGSGVSGTTILGSETQGTPTFAADGKKLSLGSALGVAAGAASYDPFVMPARDVDNNARSAPYDLGFANAV